MDLSVVTTLYKSSAFIRDFYTRMVTAASRVTDSYEIIFVNDGSPDGSLDIAVSIADTDPRVKVLDLSRNFGHHQAILAGLRETAADRIFLIDVDLEEEPEWLGRFWTTYEEGRADVVYGVAESRKGSLFKRFSGDLFYKLFNFASETPIPENVCTVRLMSSVYCQTLMRFSESNFFLAGLCAWAGFRQVPLVVPKGKRSGSSYSLLRMVRLFLAAITSFSSYPLWIVFALGVTLTVVSFSAGAYLIALKLLNPATILLGYASVIVSVWLLGGLIISFLGIIGLYLAGIFLETKRRPQYVVRRTYGGAQPLAQGADREDLLARAAPTS